MIPDRLRFRIWDKAKNILLPAISIEDICWGETSGYLNPLTIIFMQSTGLTDQNGKEIFEGDIIKSIHNDAVALVSWDHLIVTSPQKEEIIMMVGFTFHEPNSDEHIIIGNIYENPELLSSNQK